MRRTLTILIAAIGLVFVFHAASAAQLATRYRGTIPFAFSVNEYNFTAGEYFVGPLSSLANQGAVVLVNRDMGRSRIIGLGNFGNDRDRTAQMRFAYVDGRYHLAGIETPTLVLRMRRTWTGVREVAGGEPVYVSIMLTGF
ncbi:MAG: hypothetical protein QUS14_03305 [Pyrinomonadaceae bacterium]|nr:hypothetical protein [Pyrinomonadaceae bacterium]